MKTDNLFNDEQYRANGYIALDHFLTSDDLDGLRNICDALLQEPPDDDKSGQAHNIGRGNDRRFLRHRHVDTPALAAFVSGPNMLALAQQGLGQEQVYLFNEQFVAKGPKTGASFAWHQDSGYVGFRHQPYISVWIALDDATIENGTLSVMPCDLTANPEILPHPWNEQSKEKCAYQGDDPGITLEVTAGAAVMFSSLTLHSSSANITNETRRAFLVQYSPEPIIDPTTGQPKLFATQLG